MRTTFTFLSLLLLSSFIGVGAQNFTGIATYKTDRKVDLQMDSTHVNSEMQKQLQAQLRKQFQKEYTLQFNDSESLYKEVETLDTPKPQVGGVMMVVSGNSNVLYRNIKENNYVNQTEIMSKPFLIKDVLEKSDWTLEKETKSIGNYTCFKATRTEEITEQTFNSANDSLVDVKKERTTTVWYTLDIPVAHGPGEFWGLPGLILEVNDGDQSILCSKIVLNPEKAVQIAAPTSGKEVNQAEYDEIQDKKMKEMQEQFHDGNRRGEGHSMQIRIRG
jgi:GLPGLI family protein